MDIKIEKSNEKNVPWELLLLADPSKEAIEKYIHSGECYVAFQDGKIIGAYVLLRRVESIMEIMNIAVKEEMQNKGIGKLLIADAARRAKDKGMKKLLVGTGNSGLKQLAFYQKCGFKEVGIKKDYFIQNYPEPIFENGVQCRDMIILEMVL